ncbi:MAG: hypothetical protein PVJ57_02635 [Phycisphaerae bacterium]|jgi:hypothetical protein
MTESVSKLGGGGLSAEATQALIEEGIAAAAECMAGLVAGPRWFVGLLGAAARFAAVTPLGEILSTDLDRVCEEAPDAWNVVGELRALRARLDSLLGLLPAFGEMALRVGGLGGVPDKAALDLCSAFAHMAQGVLRRWLAELEAAEQ